MNTPHTSYPIDNSALASNPKEPHPRVSLNVMTLPALIAADKPTRSMPVEKRRNIAAECQGETRWKLTARKAVGLDPGDRILTVRFSFLPGS
jgi:hypothetical protein